MVVAPWFPIYINHNKVPAKTRPQMGFVTPVTLKHSPRQLRPSSPKALQKAGSDSLSYLLGAWHIRVSSQERWYATSCYHTFAQYAIQESGVSEDRCSCYMLPLAMCSSCGNLEQALHFLVKAQTVAHCLALGSVLRTRCGLSPS